MGLAGLILGAVQDLQRIGSRSSVLAGIVESESMKKNSHVTEA